MKIAPLAETSDPQAFAEEEAAVLRLLTHGTPVPPEIAQRIDERAARITERIRRTHGIIDDDAFQALLNDDNES